MNRCDTIGRRTLLTAFAGTAATSLLGGTALNAALASTPARTLSVHALNTGEHLQATYYRKGRYDPLALGEFNHLFRDWRTGDVLPIDPSLLDLLSRLHEALGASEPFQLISGYRSPQTNAALAAAGRGVARRSLHMSGMAADIRLPGYKVRSLHRAAVSLKFGGVGLYTRSNFVHVDTGDVRYWGR